MSLHGAVSLPGQLVPTESQPEQELLVNTVAEVIERIRYDAELGSMNSILMDHPHQSLQFEGTAVTEEVGPKFMCEQGSVHTQENICGMCVDGSFSSTNFT